MIHLRGEGDNKYVAGDVRPAARAGRTWTRAPVCSTCRLIASQQQANPQSGRTGWNLQHGLKIPGTAGAWGLAHTQPIPLRNPVSGRSGRNCHACCDASTAKPRRLVWRKTICKPASGPALNGFTPIPGACPERTMQPNRCALDKSGM